MWHDGILRLSSMSVVHPVSCPPLLTIASAAAQVREGLVCAVMFMVQWGGLS